MCIVPCKYNLILYYIHVVRSANYSLTTQNIMIGSKINLIFQRVYSLFFTECSTMAYMECSGMWILKILVVLQASCIFLLWILCCLCLNRQSFGKVLSFFSQWASLTHAFPLDECLAVPCNRLSYGFTMRFLRLSLTVKQLDTQVILCQAWFVNYPQSHPTSTHTQWEECGQWTAFTCSLASRVRLLA